MANKRGHIRRNKKSNNWRVIQAIKKKKISNQANGENVDIVANDDMEDESILPPPESSISEPAEDNHSSEHEINDIEMEYEFVAQENIFDCLDEDNDQSEDNPLSSDDEYYIEDLGDDDTSEIVYENNYDSGDEEENITEERNDVAEDSSESEEEDVPEEEEFKGRRIFDIGRLFNDLKKIGRHSRKCNFEDMDLIGETIRGFNSIFKFRCKQCGVIRKLRSNPPKENSMNCNEDAVLGVTSIGSGYYHLKELFTNLNVPVMGHSLYDKIQKEQQEEWFATAEESALNALYEEIELAKTIGSVDSEGNALIIAISDGGWGKRSYGKAFNSLSGCAVLIGLRTKQVIYYGTRNKYCHTCQIAGADSPDDPVKEHECNKNYSGPSSGMESDIISEGFIELEKHKARIYRLIADGDSNTYKNLRDMRLYKNPDVFIEKFECVNHLHRNFRAKFSFLSTFTKFDCELRKHVKPKKGNDISKGIKAASKHWRDSDVDFVEKIKNLEEDIMNAPDHYFGVHDKCRQYFCSKVTQEGASEGLKLLKDDGIYYEVKNLCQHYFAANAKSLLENYTNNPAEEFNNIVAKYIGGKRINFSLGKSYSARVAMAVVHYNSKGHASSEFRKHKFGESDNQSIGALENVRRGKIYANEISRQSNPNRRQERREKAKDKNNQPGYFHGDGSDGCDKNAENFQKAKKIFVDKLQNDQRNRQSIEVQTRGGKFNSYWQVIRQDRIPSSFFGRIVRAQQRRAYTNLLEELLYKRSEFGNSGPIKHQGLVERDALKVFESIFNEHTLEGCGLFLDPEIHFICSNPLKLYGNDHLLTIRCPLKEYGKTFDEAIKSIPFWKKKNESWDINKKHEWYMEIQGDLRITGRKYGFLMVWLGECVGEPQYRIVEIPRDDSFFVEEMKPKILYFFEEVMVKELVDSRRGRKMELRKYDPGMKIFI